LLFDFIVYCNVTLLLYSHCRNLQLVHYVVTLNVNFERC